MQPIEFGRYLLTEHLAAGGCAEIFKAKLIGIEGFEKTVAIKRILPHWSANQHFITMLIDEAKIMVRLNHERIVQVHELGKEGETYYIAMEFIEGIDLRNFIKQFKNKNESIKKEEAIFIISEILRGLDYIHKQKDETGKSLNIVHRDISPQNILISKEGLIKIADFGIAHASSRSYETATGVLKGKFSYMSPEQASGGVVGPQADLFATGILLYELLSGKRLFSGDGDLEILERVRRFNSEDFFKNYEVEEELKSILIRALHFNLKKRFITAQDFLKELTSFQNKLNENQTTNPLIHSLRNLESINLSIFEEKPRETMQIRQPTSQVTAKDLIIGELKKSFFKQRKIKLASILLLLIILGVISSFMIQKINLSPFYAQDRKTSSHSIFIFSSRMDYHFLLGEKIATFLPEIEPTEKGILSIKAEPWGKITIAGVVKESEHPVVKSLKYGPYQVKVAYKGVSGEWKNISTHVKIAKKMTSCIASFPTYGEGKINCR